MSGRAGVAGGRSRRLRQILTNLVGNAIKFTERAKWSRPRDWEGQAADPTSHFTVSDTGIGIPPEKQK